VTNHFKINNFYKEKNKILKELYDHWEDGERKTDFATTITDLGRSLSVLDIQDKTSLHRREIERLVISLSNTGHINLYQKDEDPNQKNHKWIITESGRQAIADNYYLNQLGIQNRELFFQLGGFVIALIALGISIFQPFQSHLSHSDVENIVKDIQHREQEQRTKTDFLDSTTISR
jgi:hypothetical protein